MAFGKGRAGGHPRPHSARSHAARSHKVTTSVRPHRHRVRSTTSRSRFQRQNPCPSTGKPSGPCPGYVVDHRVPLKRGGPDTPSNMQWQTKEAAKAKDRIE